MTTAEYAELLAQRARPRRIPRWAAIRWCAALAYVAALVAYTAVYGVPVQRELVVSWTCGALVCASIGRPLREIPRLVFDWVPIVAVLAAYDLTRGVADSIGIRAHYTTMIDFDRFVFLGQTPTEWLQARLYEPGVVHWYDIGFTLVYTSYFIVPFALAGTLWARDRAAFVRFAKRLVTLALAGLATYVAFPAAPPWMAGREGLLDGVRRTATDGWRVLDVGTAAMFSHGQEVVNLVAAVPSLHSAFVALVAMFLWPRVRPALRPLLALYPLAMGLTLIATGEHYFFDVLLGWAYAAAVMAGWARWEARRVSPASP